MGTIFMVIITVALFSHPSLQEENPLEEWNVEDLANDKYESEVRGWWGGGNRCCRRLHKKLREAKEDICENTERIISTCTALGAILENSGPQYNSSATSFPPLPSPNPVSAAINSINGTGYPIFFPITAGGAPVSGGSITDGLNIADGTPSALGTTTDTVALSVSDFNLFRQQMIIAINLLDQSIRDIVAGTPPNCP